MKSSDEIENKPMEGEASTSKEPSTSKEETPQPSTSSAFPSSPGQVDSSTKDALFEVIKLL